MMKQLTMVLVSVIIVVGAIGAIQKQPDPQLYDLKLGKKTSMSEAI